jgi:hypothetical protein
MRLSQDDILRSLTQALGEGWETAQSNAPVALAHPALGLTVVVSLHHGLIYASIARKDRPPAPDEVAAFRSAVFGNRASIELDPPEPAGDFHDVHLLGASGG